MKRSFQLIIAAIAVSTLGLLIPSTSLGFMGESRYYSSKALKEYETGDYTKAEELYGKAADKKPNSPELQYNLGSTLLKAGKLSKSVETLESVYDDKRPGLNAAARYNSGLAHHTLARKALEATANVAMQSGSAPGQGAPGNAADAGRETAIKELESAVADYRTALLAKPDDNDVKFNYELAQRELQELRQIQQQQQQQNQQEQQKEQQDQQKEQQEEDQQQSQQKDQQQDQDQQEKNQPPPQQQDQQDKDQQNQEEQQDQQKNKEEQKKDEQQQEQDQQKDEQKQQQDQQKDEQKSQGESSDQEKPEIGEMSQHDLERLLNSLPEENKQALQRFLNAKFKSRSDMERDW